MKLRLIQKMTESCRLWCPNRQLDCALDGRQGFSRGEETAVHLLTKLLYLFITGASSKAHKHTFRKEHIYLPGTWFPSTCLHRAHNPPLPTGQWCPSISPRSCCPFSGRSSQTARTACKTPGATEVWTVARSPDTEGELMLTGREWATSVTWSGKSQVGSGSFWVSSERAPRVKPHSRLRLDGAQHPEYLSFLPSAPEISTVCSPFCKSQCVKCEACGCTCYACANLCRWTCVPAVQVVR